jgi:hypothetical protein
MEHWSIGIMEYWCNDFLNFLSAKDFSDNIPALQCSITT